jgi:hypothetical protein
MANVAKTSLRELFRAVSKKIPHAEILRASGIKTTRKPSSYISQSLTTNESIPYPLADYILAQTILADDPLQRALNSLGETGIPQTDLDGLEKVIRRMIPLHKQSTETPDLLKPTETPEHLKPIGPAFHQRMVETLPQTSADMTVDHDVIKPGRVIALTTRAREEKQDYGLQTKRLRVASTTIPPAPAIRKAPESLSSYKCSFTPKPDFRKVPTIENLAAGHNDESYEIVSNAYVEGCPPNCVVARVKGESMLPTLNDGALILLKNMDNGGHELPQIDDESHKTDFREWKGKSGIKDGGICVLKVTLKTGQEYGPTLKRIEYDTRRGEANWKMAVVADNPSAWMRDITIQRGDHVVVYAMLLGLLEEV